MRDIIMILILFFCGNVYSQDYTIDSYAIRDSILTEEYDSNILRTIWVVERGVGHSIESYVLDSLDGKFIIRKFSYNKLRKQFSDTTIMNFKSKQFEQDFFEYKFDYSCVEKKHPQKSIDLGRLFLIDKDQSLSCTLREQDMDFLEMMMKSALNNYLDN